jgi:hypothetical protein
MIVEHLLQTMLDLKIVFHLTQLTFSNFPELVELIEFKDSIVLVNTIITEKLYYLRKLY